MPVPYMTNIILYSGVPWDNTYTDVRLFDGGSVSIPGKVLGTVANASYQRVNSSVASERPAYTVRVPIVADKLYNCNYLSFNNSNKTFYAFVNKVNFINTNNTELVYEIDEFTTWFYDCDLQACFVEREHAETDSVGDNTVYEPIGSFDMYETQISQYFPENQSVIVLTASDDPAEFEPSVSNSFLGGYWKPIGVAPGGMIGNVYQAYQVNGPFASASEVDTFLSKYAEVSRAAGIIGVYTVKNTPGSYDWYFNSPTTLQGETSTPYEPKNKKLLTAQFNACILAASSGESIELSFEKFGGIGQCHIRVDMTPAIPVIATAAPYYIKNEPNYNYNLQAEMSVSSPYLIDNYADEMGRKRTLRNRANLVQATAESINAALQGKANKLSSAAISANVAAVRINHMADKIAYDINAKAISPSFVKGTDDITAFDLGRVGFWVSQKCVGNEAAIQIDDYFDMYGYATMAPKVPNTTGRALFNYVKTRECVITGSIPAQSMAALKNMFNSGIRLWHTNDIGSYDPATGNPIA